MATAQRKCGGFLRRPNSADRAWLTECFLGTWKSIAFLALVGRD